MSHAPVALASCPNCGRALDGAFCADCGQKVGPVNPTLHDFVHDFIHELVHVDGKIFRSVRLLFTRPGFLTREYFEGRRARYVSPIRLYLIFSVIYFAVAAVAPASSQGGVRVSVSDDAEARELGFENEQAMERAVNTALKTWTPRVMFVLVPLLALLVYGAARGSGRNYPQHLYFAFHVHAAGFAVLTISTAARYARSIPFVTGTIQVIAVGWLFVYLVLALRRAYGGTAARAVLRAAVVSVVYLLALILAMVGVVMPIFNGRLF